MRFALDLDAYLHRIGHAGPAAPDLATLRALALAHAMAIPYENLDPLLGLPVDLDPAALEDKLVHGGRGGYCFEHNLLFAEALRAVGFAPVGLIARVLWNRPEDAVTAQTHMLLRVPLDGADWLVDVGFGSMTLTGALRLAPDAAQATPHGPFRLLRQGDGWRMQAQVLGEWRSLYRFDLHPCERIDYEVSNHYVSTHPQSQFVQTLAAARCTPDARLALRNREFAVHPLGGATERCTLARPEQIRHVLESEFRIRLPRHPGLERRLAALP
jgi:N-hydroxyarylamine O-acetyltransferase